MAVSTSTCEPARDGDQRLLALDVALLELDVLLRQLGERGCSDLRVALQIGEVGAHGGELGLRLRRPRAERLADRSRTARRRL